MPYKSRAQAAYFNIHMPKMAKEWNAASKGMDLPEHAHEARKRHTGSMEAKKLGQGSHVSAHSSTHMKSRMKRY